MIINVVHMVKSFQQYYINLGLVNTCFDLKLELGYMPPCLQLGTCKSKIGSSPSRERLWTRVLQMAQLASALAHLKTKQLRFVVQKTQKMLAAPTRGYKKLRLKRRGGQNVSAQKRKSAHFELPCYWPF